MIYVDKLRDWGWKLGPSCHLFTDGPNEELHAFALRLGLKRAWFQKGSMPHYDLTARKRSAAMKLGAAEASDEQMVAVKKAWTAVAVARVKACATEAERNVVRDDLYR